MFDVYLLTGLNVMVVWVMASGLLLLLFIICSVWCAVGVGLVCLEVGVFAVVGLILCVAYYVCELLR